MTDRLLFTAPAAYPWGGLATWLAYLLPQLTRKGWHPILGLTAGEHHDVEAYRRAYPALETVAISNPTGSPAGRSAALVDTFKRIKPAMVLGVNIPDSYAAIARMRMRGQTAPRAAMTIHGIQPDLIEDAHRFRTVLDAVVCTNRLACALAEQMGGITPQRLHYAPYGVPKPAQAAPTPAPHLRIAYVGRLEQWQKRIADIPLIVQALVNQGIAFELLIAGSGPDESSLRQSLAPHEQSGHVRFVGTLSPAQLVEQVYRQADALLLTSLWETGPIVIWEAMSHGLCIVSSRYIGSGLEGALTDGDNCLLFPVGNWAAAADCIARLSNPALRQQLSLQGRALVESRYSESRSADAWDACLREALEAPPLPVPQHDPAPIPALGRLDRWLGVPAGERVRSIAGRRYRHAEPGGEWPHTFGMTSVADPIFWESAATLDHPIK